MKTLPSIEEIGQRYLEMLVVKKTTNPVTHHWIEEVITQDRANTIEAVKKLIKERGLHLGYKNNILEQLEELNQ